MSTLIGRLLVGTKLDPSGFRDGARKSTRHLTAFEKRTKSISRGITRSMGALGAAFAISSIVQNAGKTVVDFDQKVANLASTTGRSKDSISALVQNAKNVGAVSAFSATQVLDLQTELAKLGNSEQEIISMTKSVGDFSIAVGATAADAAILTGGVLKSFGKTAKETESVVSSLAVATTKSALDFNKLNVALPIVGTAAKLSGETIESLTAKLGVLADRNIDASTSGTALRNIFLRLKKQGITYDEAMQRINNSTDKLAEANKLFGERGATVAAVLAESSIAADNLENSITGVDGALKSMTDERLNTLQGQFTLLKSSWEGFVLSLESGDGILSAIAKGALQELTGVVSTFTEINKGGLFEDGFVSGIENVLTLRFGSEESRSKLVTSLEAIRKKNDDISKGRLTSGGSDRTSLYRGRGTKKEDPLSEAIKKLGEQTDKTKPKVLSLKQEISSLEDKVSALSIAYIKGGSSDDNIIDSITSKQAKIKSLNSTLEQSIILTNKLREGERGQVSNVNSILSGDQRSGFQSGISSEGQNVQIDNDYIQRSIEYTNSLADATTKLTGIYPTLGEAAAAAMSTLGASLESGAASFTDFAGTILKGIQQVIGGLIKQTVASAVSSVFTSLPFPANLAAAGLVGSLASGIFNTALNSINPPKLAKGGVIDKPTFAMLGEYPGAQNNPEIAAPEKKLRAIFSGVLASQGSGGRLYGQISGRDIFLSQKRESEYRNRTAIA